MCRAGALHPALERHCALCRAVALGQVRVPMQPTLTPLMMCCGGMRTTIRSVSSSFWAPALTASMGDTSRDRAGRLPVRLCCRESRGTRPDPAQPEPNPAVADCGTGGTTGPRAQLPSGEQQQVATAPSPSPAAAAASPASPRLGLKAWPRLRPRERRGEEEAEVLVMWPGTEPGTAEGPGATFSLSFSAFRRSTSSWWRSRDSRG